MKKNDIKTRANSRFLKFSKSRPRLCTLSLLLLFISSLACDDINDPLLNSDKISNKDAGKSGDKYTKKSGGIIPDYSNLDCSERPAFAGQSFGRLLTKNEYNHAIEDLFNDHSKPAEQFPPENQSSGFKNGIEHQSNALLVELYMKSAEDISERYIAAHPALATCISKDIKTYTESEKLCQKELLKKYMVQLFRHPAERAEQDIFETLFEQRVTDGDSSSEAFTLTLQAMLQSPQFLYRFEFGAEKGEKTLESMPLTDHEIASRLSFFLFNSVPDQALLDAANTGQLHTAAQIAAHTDRMLQDPKFERSLRDFHEQWLHLELLSSSDKDTNIYTNYTNEMKNSWSESIQQFLIQEIFNKNGTLQTMLESEAVYINPLLASLYNIDLGDHTGFNKQQWASEKRAGLLTQPGLMALLANPGQSSPIKRGIFLREKFLCEPITPPPPELITIPPDPDPNATTRERFAQHTDDPVCAGCHILIDPLGFGFENYDGIGQFRTQENGLNIDSTGELAYTQSANSDMEGTYDGIDELAKRLQKGDQVYNCISSQWFRYAMARHEVKKDRCNLAPVQNDFYNNGGYFKDMIKSITSMPAFRTRSMFSPGEQS